MPDEYADALLRLEGRTFRSSWDALVAAQDFADEHKVVMYVLEDRGEGYAVTDRGDDLKAIYQMAVPPGLLRGLHQ